MRTIPKNTPLIFLKRAPGKGNNVQVQYNIPTIDKNLPFVWYQIWVLGSLLLLSAHNQKVESALTITQEAKLLRTNTELD